MAKSTLKKHSSSGLGLEELGDVASLLDGPKRNMSPIELDIELIDEDKNQPRTVFDDATLKELAETIRERGVKTPISVRPSKKEGRYIINHGARRYRASIIAGKETIPAYVDADYAEEDQIIENLHRDELTAREIANFIGRKIGEGMKQRAVGKLIGKSESYISQHLTLNDLPEPISTVFNNARCGDVTVIYELVTAYKKAPEKVATWLEDESQEITRRSVKDLREFLAESAMNAKSLADEDEDDGHISKSKKIMETDKSKMRNPIIRVEFGGKIARLILNKRPPSKRTVWVTFEESGKTTKVGIEHLTLFEILPG